MSTKDILLFLSPYLSYVLVACGVYLFRESKMPGAKPSFKLKSLVSYCFPSKNYWSKSAGIDLMISFLNSLVTSPLFFIPWSMLMIAVHFDNQFLIASSNLSFGDVDFGWINWAIALIIFVLLDGVNAAQHYLAHRIPFLWEFHKVHHSAPVLNLWTAERHHPVSVMIANLSMQATLVLLVLIFRFLIGDTLNMVMVWAISNLLGIILKPVDMIKHTHLWISWGPLSYVVQSPAMHQMHHSVEAKYHHKNFAGFFSFWDLAMGTLYIPEGRPDLVLGLKKPVWGNKRLDTFWGSLWDPFKSARP